MSRQLDRDRLALRRALVLGTSRASLEIPEALVRSAPQARVLSVVAALGVRSRFDRAEPPARFVDRAAAHDPARILGARSRALLSRMYSLPGSGPAHAVDLRLLDLIAARHRVLHPFDYPLLAEMMRADVDKLDPRARDWLAGVTGGDSPALHQDDVDDETWADQPPAVRASYLSELRQRDPTRARSLCAETISSDTAAVRARLLSTFEVGLGADDVTMLEGFASDRAASVRRVAESLLARIPGTEAFASRVEQACDALELRRDGLPGRRRALRARRPPGLPDAKLAQWFDQTFADVSPSLLAARLELAADEFAQALTEPALHEVLCLNAAAADEVEMARALGRQLDAPSLNALFERHGRRLARLASQRRVDLWSVFTPALVGVELASASMLMARLYESLRVVPPAGVCAALRNSRHWVTWRAAMHTSPDTDQAAVAEILIAFAPRQERLDLCEALAGLPPALVRGAMIIADLLAAIDADGEVGDA